MTAEHPERLNQTGRLDPETADLADRPKRKARNRPDPSPELRKWEQDAERRMFNRPFPPNVILEPAGMDKEHWTSAHSDPGLWQLQLADAFGTRSAAVVEFFFGQIHELCGRSIWDDEAQQWRISETDFSAMLAIINSHKPRNEIEAMLAAQMVAVHLLTMKVAERAIRWPHEIRTVSNVAKLANAFSQQMETMQAVKGRRRSTRQSIKVSKELHQHVHYHDHRGGKKNNGRPHERDDGTAAGIDDQRPALSSADTGGNVVPLSGHEGKGALPETRGQVTRRSKG